MRALLVSDLHYDLRKLDWVLAEAAGVDVLVLAGDLLDIASSVPLEAQIEVVLEYISRASRDTTVVICSGNHDLDHRTASGEKATAWINEARGDRVAVDGDSVTIDGFTITACAWWEGAETLRALESVLDEAAATRRGPWIWVWHGPPEGPLSWTGSRHYGDPELPRLLDRHQPDVVLCGHIHQAPFVPGGAWAERRGDAWLFNGGHQLGPVPTHVRLDLEARTASWWSFEGAEDLVLDRDRGSVVG
ncbi:MAG: metallophosphoesterase [Ilumatobacteraceae bacterium]